MVAEGLSSSPMAIEFHSYIGELLNVIIYCVHSEWAAECVVSLRVCAPERGKAV